MSINNLKKMKFVLILFAVFVIACKGAEKKDTKNTKEKDEFLLLAGLGHLRAYVGNDMNYTVNCYMEIKEVYEKAIDDFMEDVSQSIGSVEKYYDDPKLKYKSKSCFEELYKIARALFWFKNLLHFHIRDNQIRETYDLARDVKPFISPFYDKYLKHKSYFSSQPASVSNYFYEKDKSCREKFINNIKDHVEKFIACGEKTRETSVK